MKRFIAVCLALLLLIPTLSSCSDDSGSKIGDTTTLAESTAETRPYLDSLGSYNFDGENFSVLCRKDTEYEVAVDELTGDLVDDEIYKRNLEVSERFNVKIVRHAIDGLWPQRDAFMKTLIDEVAAGGGSFDLVLGYQAYMCGVGLADYLRNIHELPAVDLKARYYYHDIIDQITINGKLLYLVGDYTLTVWKHLFVYFFNKQLATDYNMPDLYQLVRDGKWTIDKLIELSADVYADINGDSKEDDGDLYGLATDYGNIADAYYSAFEIPITVPDENGLPTINTDISKFDSVVNKLADYIHNSTGVYSFKMVSTMTETPLADMFVAGRALFFPDMLDNAVKFRGLETDFGILPYPKWDESQKLYRSQSWNGYNVMVVPKDAQNLEKTGVLIEALNAASLKTVVPTYFDTALKLKFTRDDESGEMLEIIREGISYQFGYFFQVPLYAGCEAYRIRDLVEKTKPTVASTFKSVEKKLNANLEELLKVYIGTEP